MPVRAKPRRNQNRYRAKPRFTDFLNTQTSSINLSLSKIKSFIASGLPLRIKSCFYSLNAEIALRDSASEGVVVIRIK